MARIRAPAALFGLIVILGTAYADARSIVIGTSALYADLTVSAMMDDEDDLPGTGGSVDPAEVEAVSQVKARHEEALLQVRGVIGVGVGLSTDTGRVVIQVYVAELSDRIREELPAFLDDVPVEIVETGEFRAL